MFPQPEAFLGKTLGGYQLKRVIGSGGAGTVYLGENDAGEQVAVKVLLPAMRVSPEELEGIRQRFLREAEVLERLRHPHILPLLAFDADSESGNLFMVMPLLTGGTLADRLKQGSLPFDDVSRYITQLADALDYAHAQGVIHRDIKPSNVLLDAQGQAVLADFGIAKMVDSLGMTLTATGAILGTPEYMALEQLQGQNDAITAATDVYGLAALAYHLLTDTKPYTAATPQAVIVAIVQSVPVAPGTLRHDLPAPADAVIMKALARKPEFRFATTGAFAAALAEGLRGIWPAGVTRPTLPPTVAANVPPTVTPPARFAPPPVAPGPPPVAPVTRISLGTGPLPNPFQPPSVPPQGGFPTQPPQQAITAFGRPSVPPSFQQPPPPWSPAGSMPPAPPTPPSRNRTALYGGIAAALIAILSGILFVVHGSAAAPTTSQPTAGGVATPTPMMHPTGTTLPTSTPKPGPTATFTLAPNPTATFTPKPGPTATFTPTPTPTPTQPPPTASITVRSQSIQLTGGQTGSVSVSCQGGEQLVGGGFATDPYIAVYSSYPSSSSTWTLNAYDYSGSSPLAVTVYANCIQANVDFGLQIVSTPAQPPTNRSTSYSANANCPGGTFATGGGIQATLASAPQVFSDAPIMIASYASNIQNGWFAKAASGNVGASLQAYAICAASHASLAEVPMTSTVISGTNQGISLQCSGGNELLTSGGYQSSANDQSFKPFLNIPVGNASSQWQFGVRAISGTSPTGTFYGLCISYQ